MTIAGGAGPTDLILRCQYADTEADYLHFRLAEAAPGGEPGAVTLIETPLAGRLGPEPLAYLHTFKSFPAFLARITLDSFETSTMSSTMM